MVEQRNLIETEKIITDSLHGEKIEFKNIKIKQAAQMRRLFDLVVIADK
ncbi:MAG: hypothetical protein LUD19_05105 [Clostridia bacterium]|nr:hypothetical protein [Clostridia bacterium]